MELTSQWTKALEPNIFEWLHNGFNRHPDSTGEIFGISDSTLGLIRFKDSWGPRLVSKSSEAATTHESARQDGHVFIAIHKFLLNIGKVLNRITRGKQVNNRAAAETKRRNA